MEWARGLSETLTLHLCCLCSVLGVSLPGERKAGLLESPVPDLGRPFKARVTQGPEVMSVETYYPSLTDLSSLGA